MRLRVLACSCLLVAVSVGGVKTLASSPDCARWIKEYQEGLAKRGALAKKHVVHAARRLHVPHLRPARAIAPTHRLRPAKLSPQEMLKRFRVLCGEDLPDDTMPVAFVPTGLEALVVPPVAFPDVTPLTDIGQPVSFVPGSETPVQSAPTTTTTTTTGSTTPPIIVTDTGAPGGGTTPPATTTGVPPIITDTPVPSPVPEPTSLVLLLTGAAGTLPFVLRRRRS